MSHPRLECSTGTTSELAAWEVFEAFAKAVIRNYGRNLHRAYFRRQKREKALELFVPDDAFSVDTYFREEQKITVDSHTYYIRCDLLYEGLMLLATCKRETLILHYWEGQTDEALGQRMAVSSRTIRRWRQQSLADIQQYIGGRYEEGNRPEGQDTDPASRDKRQ